MKQPAPFGSLDPLGLFKGGTSAGVAGLRRPKPAADPDWRDLVDTVIAEAGGEGPRGMAAVAHAIKNRAANRGLAPAEVVRQPKQFTGYEAPGPDAVKAQADPQMRALAEKVVSDVFGGVIPDETGGADHFHTPAVSPDWASAMPMTAEVGGHRFYNSGRRQVSAGDRDDDGVAGDPDARGLARLAPPKRSTSATDFLTQRLVGHSAEHVTGMEPRLQDRLASMFQAAPPEIAEGLGIFSGYRSVERQEQLWNAALKKYGSAAAARKWVAPPGRSNHNHGRAADLSYKGKSLKHAPKEVLAWVHANAETFGLKFPMAHEPWHIEVSETRGGKAMSGAFKAATTAAGKDAIVLDSGYEPRDGMGLFRDRENPFAALASQPEPPNFENPPLVEEDPADDAIDVLEQLEAAEPGRYEAIDADQYEDWRQRWEAEQPGLLEDLGRSVGGGVIKGVGHIVQGLGEALRLATTTAMPGIPGPRVDRLINGIFGTDFEVPNPLEVPADWIAKYGEGVQQGMSFATREAFEQSQPDGDILDPSTWSLGENPSLRGYTALGLDVFGSLLPVVTAAVLTGPIGAATIGGAQGGGAAQRTAHEIIDGMAAREGVLERESAYYREQIAAGKTPEEALAATRDAAGQLAFIYTAPISAMGGAVTGKLLDPATKVLAGQNIVARIGGRAALSGVEEGAQEAAESVATRAGVNEAAGTDLSVTEGTFGDFVLGAIGGSAIGAPAGALSQREEAPVDNRDMPEVYRNQGPLARALEHGEQRGNTAQRYRVDDPPIDDMGAGELHGEVVTRAPDQEKAPAGMVRVIDGSGEVRVIGERLLVPEAPQPAGRPVKPGEPKAGRKAETPRAEGGTAAVTEPAPAAAEAAPAAEDAAQPGDGGLPRVRSRVRVEPPGMEPFEGTVESHVDGEAIVFDDESGEIYQIEPGFMTEIAPPPDADMPPPAAPAAAETTTEPAPADEMVPAGRRTYPPLKVGDNVVVDAGDGTSFSARVESWEEGGSEALVTKEDGSSVQVPFEAIRVSKLTPKQVEKQDLERNPPVARDPAPAAPTDRKVFEATVTLPDDRHARMYDLGKQRDQARRFEKGRGGLIADEASRPTQQRLADEFGISYEAAGQMADDYRYRVERAAKSRRSDLPVRMHPVDERYLRQWQADRRRAEQEAAQGLDPETWWDGELTGEGRRRVMASAGIKRSDRTLWKNLPKGLQERLWKARGAAEPETDGATDIPENIPAPAASIDEAAAEAASSPENGQPEPSEAQKEAGNYRKGHHRLGGLDLSIENPAGSTRSGTDAGGKPWSVEMKSHYGYIRRTEGKDGDHVDVFVRPGTDALEDSAPVFVVDQVNGKTRRFDEHKVMLGFDTLEAAQAAYQENYAKGWKGLGAITPTTLGEFKGWLENGDTTKVFWRGGGETGSRPVPALAESIFTPIEKRAFDVYARIADEAAANPTETSRKPEWQRQLAEVLTNPGRFHPVVEQENARGIRIGDAVKAKGRPGLVVSVQQNGATMQAKVASTSGYPGWYDIDTLDLGDGAPRAESSVAEAVEKARGAPQVRTPAKRKAVAPAADRKPTTETEDEVLQRMGERHSVKGFLEMLVTKPLAQVAGVIDRKGRIWEITGTSDLDVSPNAGAHGHLFTELHAANIFPDWPVDRNLPYVQITRYGKQIGLGAHELTDAQASAAKVLMSAAEREGVTVITTEGLPELIASTKAKEPTRESKEKLPEAVNTPAAVEQKLAEWGAENRLVTRDRAAEVRRRLKEKLRGQINAGIDPEVLALGAELAAFHIEAGARRFTAFTKAVADDMETSIEALRPYLRAWYNAARDLMEDSGLSIEGMDDADAVRAALKRLDDGAEDGRAQELDRGSQGALEGAPAEPVSEPQRGRNARSRPEGGREPDLFGGEPARGERVPPGRGVGDGAGALPVPAGRGQRTDAGAEPQSRDGGSGEARPALDAVELAAGTGVTPAQDRAVDYTITDADAIGTGGAKTKFRNNVAAIRVLRALEAENRPATREEQSVLAKWVGWGGLAQAFRRPDGSIAQGWTKEVDELRELLSDEELRAAEQSTRNAHYTAPEVVKAMWGIAERLGFSGGQVLEPSVGAGNFVGMMPAGLKQNARITGVELDTITGGIARALYPHANIRVQGFQTLTLPDGWFDLAIGNPPFGSEKLYDAERRNLNQFSIHNYFFAKSVAALRPGGVLAMVVTNYFLDAQDSRARRHIARHAKLVGAIRLPNNAFLKNAGTEVTTDIIVLQKRAEPLEDVNEDTVRWTKVATHRDKEGRTVPLNAWYVDNPDRMLGEFGAYGTMYSGEEPALVSRAGDDLQFLLKKALIALPDRIMPPPAAVETVAEAVPTNAESAMVGSAFLSPEGELWARTPDHVGEARAERLSLDGKAAERVTGLVRVRDAFTELRRLQVSDGASDASIAAGRTALNEAYDAFVKANGPINADANKRLFRDDPTWPQVAALETDFDKGVSSTVARRTGEAARAPSAKKAAIFTKRTQQPYRRPTSARTAKDALSIVLADRGRVDLGEMARLYGKSEDAITAELGGLLYRAPDGAWQTADHYLSGNVKQKLAEAERAAKDDPAFQRNVDALRDVIPADIEAVDIDVKPGVPWVPPRHVAAFADHITEGEGSRAIYSAITAKWAVDAARPSTAAETQWGTDRVGVRELVAAVMNGKAVTVYDRHRDGTSTLNAAATEAAADKAEKIKAEWRRWIFEDDARRDELARIYNDTYNTDVVRRFDGSHLTLPGKVSDDIIDLRPHQKNFVWRALQSSTVLADHVVGSGKTFEVIAAVMEMRRTGQAKKPIVVVPNHLVGQWAADFVKLYPGAKILAATKKDFEADNRKKLFARAATGDFDAVIVAHSSFGRIPVSPEFEERFIREQMDELEEAENVLRAEDGKKGRSVKELAKRRETLQTKLKKLNDAGAKDIGLTFEEIGFDAIVVDEAHEFKNLAFATSMTRVAGLGNPSGSQKAADLYMKVKSVLERTGGRNIVFATGTPLSNTMAEMFTVQRYLDGDAIKAMGVGTFDAWARVFGEVVSDWELSPSGQYRLNSRFARFVNMPELMQRYLSFADVITNDDIKAMLAKQGKTLPLPKVKGGKPENVVVERSPQQAAFIGVGTEDAQGNTVFPHGSLVWRAENLPKRAEKGADNMLKVMSDARKAALDMRLIDPAAGDHPGSKVHIAADRMTAIWKRWAAKRGTQLVFIDLSTPKKARAAEEARLRDLIARADAGDEAAQNTLDAMSPDEFMALDGAFSVYDDLRQKLTDRGVPDAEIAFIHDANTEAQKEELFGKVRSGRVRFLFGSTAKMGAGTNVQNRLVALHHLDAPWRPSDLEQRDGRGIRQGNELYAENPEGFEIEILRYATKNTLDARQWQTIEGKARFIQQMRKGDIKTRIIEDIAGEAANAAEMKAASSGNPLILEEMELRHRLRRLEGQEAEHAREQHRIRDRVRALKSETTAIEARLPALEADATLAAAAVEAGMTATVRGKATEKPGELGTALLDAVKAYDREGIDEADAGELGAFSIGLMRTREDNWDIVLSSELAQHELSFNAKEADDVGLGIRVSNMVRRLRDGPAQARERLGDIARQIPSLERQVAPFARSAEIDEVRSAHQDVLARLKPKQKPAAPQPDPEAKASIADPVATITGDELGVAEGAPRAALRRAAFRWYVTQLRGTTATMADGTTVSFNRRGGNESTSGKGDTLLRAIPAIRAIIEQGEVVLREPGRDPRTVRERLIIAAPVTFMGQRLSLAVSVHVTPNGNAHYDFTFDSGARSPGVGVPGEATKARPSTQSAVMVDGASGLPTEAGAINLFVWRGESNRTATTSLSQELERGALAEFIGPLLKSGKVKVVAADGAPAGWQGWTDPDGTISLVEGRIPPGRATSVLLHEAFHAGVRPLTGEKGWQALMGRLGALHRQFQRSKGTARGFYDRAAARVERAGATGDLAVEEFGAYAIEEYEAAGSSMPGALKRWVDDAIGYVKAFVLRRFGRQVGQVTPAQLRMLAMAALGGAAEREAAAAPLLTDTEAGLPVAFPDVFHARLFTLGRQIAHASRLTPGAAALGEYDRLVVPEGTKPEIAALEAMIEPFMEESGIVDAALGYYGTIADEAHGAPASKRRIDAGRVIDPDRLDEWLGTLAGRSRAWGERLFSKAAPNIKASIIDENRVVEEVSGKLTDLQPAALATVPLNYFPELAQPGMTGVNDYLKVKRLLDAYRGKKHAQADATAQKWLKYARLGFGGKGKAKAAALADLMHDATLAGVDPSMTEAQVRADAVARGRAVPAQYAAMRARYVALSQAGQDLFEEVRDAYTKQADELDRILLDNVRKAQEIAQRRAEAEFKQDIEKINRSRATVADKKEAIEKATADYEAKSKRAGWSAKARVTKLRMAFEASRVEQPYFPLARYGRYFVSVRDVDGSVLSFSRREKAAERDRLAAEMRRAYPTATVEAGVMEASGELRAAMDPRLVAEIEQIVGGAGLDAGTTATVLDQIWQRYLQTMPDLSARKRFIHRKGTAGYDGDALRAFTHHMFHAAHQMGRLKYGMELQELVNETTDQAKKAADPTKGMTLANELRKRHDWVMNPVGGKVAQTMTSTAFVWFLATSPAAAIVNMTQTPMLGIPILGSRFGVAKAANALLKASIDSVRGRGSVAHTGLTQDESAALGAFYESGLIDRSQAHDLAGVGEVGVEYSPLRARVMGVMSWMFHRAEVWNREVTALAAYRLAKQAGQRGMNAVDTAHDLTWKVHFDYSNSSRARVMQSDTAKVLLVFRAHNINMLYRFFRDAHQAFAGSSPQARKEARMQLAGVVGMQALFAGAKGVIGFNAMMALAGLFFGDDDDPLDFETQFQRDVLEVLGPELGGIALNGVPGHYLGISLTNRIGMPDLWFRSPSRELQGKDEYTYWVQQFLGATVGMGENMWRGVDLAMDGNVVRGVETAAPKWVRDLMRAYRHGQEGVTTLRGDEILPAEEIHLWETVAQAIGFTPAKVNETYERNNALKNAETRLTQQRSRLLNDFVRAVEGGDKEARQAAGKAIQDFNALPTSRPIVITPDTIRRSLRARARNAAKRIDGALIQNDRLGRALREKMPAAVYR